jgi:predicted lactoylglutathione lyase
MHNQIFVNLPVKDLQKSIAFFTELGYTFNPQFTDTNATCMILGENMFAMLLVEPMFQTFTKKPLADAKRTTEVLVALSVESREKIDEMMQKAVQAGGSIYRDADDHGWMYSQSFADLDGHQWELLWMDPKGMPQR